MDKKLFVATQEGPLEQLAHQVDLCWESLENLTTITLQHHVGQGNTKIPTMN